MIAFADMLIPMAKQAGIVVPEDLDNHNPADYPHWRVFCAWQLGRSIRDARSHWHNAEVIAAIPAEELTTITWGGLFERGCI